jgi:hypothetical protein
LNAGSIKPNHIDHPHDQDEQSESRPASSELFFAPSRQQRQKWKRELQNDDRERNHAPTAVVPRDVPGCFFRQIARTKSAKLRERESKSRA